MSQEVLTISVKITDNYWVEGSTGRTGMITFTGDADCPLFKGHILPGGVDTQTIQPGLLTLSARYMLEGEDSHGTPCHVFIENNGSVEKVSQPMRTIPKITTDSPHLQWLEHASLYGTLEPNGENAVLIHIFVD